jgi:hypothetical protein
MGKLAAGISSVVADLKDLRRLTHPGEVAREVFRPHPELEEERHQVARGFRAELPAGPPSPGHSFMAEMRAAQKEDAAKTHGKRDAIEAVLLNTLRFNQEVFGGT